MTGSGEVVMSRKSDVFVQGSLVSPTGCVQVGAKNPPPPPSRHPNVRPLGGSSVPGHAVGPTSLGGFGRCVDVSFGFAWSLPSISGVTCRLP